NKGGKVVKQGKKKGKGKQASSGNYNENNDFDGFSSSTAARSSNISSSSSDEQRYKKIPWPIKGNVTTISDKVYITVQAVMWCIEIEDLDYDMKFDANNIIDISQRILHCVAE